MQIDHIAVKGSIQLEAANGTRTWLKRVRRNVWKLDNPHNPRHCRWGNHEEIQSDIAFFLQTGRVPMGAAS